MKIFQYTTNNMITRAGGATKVFCEMANALTVRGHEVYAVCNDFHTGRLFYPLDDRVHFINLDGSGHRKHKPLTWKFCHPFRRLMGEGKWEQFFEAPFHEKKGEPLVKLIREIQPDVVIPYSVSDYFSMLRQPKLSVPAVLMIHGAAHGISWVAHTRQRIEKINTCPHLQVLHHSFVPEIRKIYHGSIHVIPNGVPQVAEKDMADLTVEKPQKTIAMISRLEPGKQQHLLIQSFHLLTKKYPEWKVEIYGPPIGQTYFRKLKKMIVSLGLVGQIELLGTTDCPLDVLRQADIFAFPSRSEGFSLALTEAMAVGLPCVGLKQTPSVNELIVDGVNGFLADNTPEDFAEKLKILMDDRNLRVKMGKAGHEMMKQYAPERVWHQWEELIETVVHQQRKAA